MLTNEDRERILERILELEKKEQNKTSEIYFFDDNDNIVPEPLATKYIIRETTYCGDEPEFRETFGEILSDNDEQRKVK